MPPKPKKQDTEEDILRNTSIAKSVEQQLIIPSYNSLATKDFNILSTIRYDPFLFDNFDVQLVLNDPINSHAENLFFLFHNHVERIRYTINYFKFGFEIGFNQLLLKLVEVVSQLDYTQPYKLRVLISPQGHVKIEAYPVEVRLNLIDGFQPIVNYVSPIYRVYIDTEPIMISPFTSFKTTKRDQYSQARSRCLNPEDPSPQEVLLFNSNNNLTEGSITNVAIKDPKQQEKNVVKWVTPMLSSGCLCGVVRHMLLSKGLVEERKIMIDEVHSGDEVLLFNGIVGVVKGIVM